MHNVYDFVHFYLQCNIIFAYFGCVLGPMSERKKWIDMLKEHITVVLFIIGMIINVLKIVIYHEYMNIDKVIKAGFMYIVGAFAKYTHVYADLLVEKLNGESENHI